MKERTGELNFKGNPLTLLGEAVKVGQQAPDFRVRGGLDEKSMITLETGKGKVRVFNVVPSLDTPVCETQTIKFNDEAAKIGDHIEIMTVSMDLPTAQNRFCTMQLNGESKVKMASDYAEKSFGINYGILIKEWQILGRGIFIIDRNNVVRHVEYVPKVEELPDLKKAMDVLKSLL